MASFRRWNYPNLDKFKKDYLYFYNTSLEKQIGFSLDEIYIVDGEFKEEDAEKINSLNREIFLIFDNTKGLEKEALKKLNDNITISITGGLDYINKKKFQNLTYLFRTVYKPKELIPIIEYFEKIEGKLKKHWTETQKSLFIFKTLVNNLHYKYDNESSHENGRDVARSLSGLIYGKLVCSGFALVFKEAMDRIGVPCLYQNRESSHSWNVAKLDGKYRGMELTWACYNKSDGGFSASYFGADPKFYDNPHHDLSNEDEEKEMNLTSFTYEELLKQNDIVNIDKVYAELKIPKKDGLDIFIKNAGSSSFLENIELDLNNGYISLDDVKVIIQNIEILYSKDEVDNLFGKKLDYIMDKYFPKPKNMVENKDKVTINDTPLEKNENELPHSNDFIKETNIYKPRLRDVYETDEEYTKYLKEYYETYFDQTNGEDEIQKNSIAIDKKCVIFEDGGKIHVVSQDFGEEQIDLISSSLLDKARRENLSIELNSLDEGVHSVGNVIVNISKDGIISVNGEVDNIEFYNQEVLLLNPTNPFCKQQIKPVYGVKEEYGQDQIIQGRSR